MSDLDPEQQHRLDVRLDIARERLLLWRIGVMFTGLAAVLLLRSIVLAGM